MIAATAAAASLDRDVHEAARVERLPQLLVYTLLGTGFGSVLTLAQVVSWFRIQEMFRFQSWHMYGTILTAILTAAVSLLVIRRSGVRALDGSPIVVPPKVLGRGTRYWAGGMIFGIGWSLVGACPGPLLALVGGGTSVMLATLAGALGGTWLYGVLRPRLPH